MTVAKVFVPVLVALFLTATSTFAQSAEAQFAAADRDGDRALNRAEFRTFMKSQAASGNGAARTVTLFRVYGIAFRRIDKDANGLISQSELAAAAGTQVPSGG